MTSKYTKYLFPILLILLLAGTASALPTATHDTVRGEMYVSSIANWPSTYSTNNFDVPNGTVVFARYYVGVWASSGTPTSISTTFNGYNFPTNPDYYSTGMGVTWIPYDVTDNVHPGETNTATINTASWGDGRQYGSTLVVVLKNESKPQIEYWIADGLDWMHYGDYLGYEVQNSTTYFNGTVNLSDVQSASLHSIHLTGFNYEDLNGNSLPSATESVNGDYFNYIRWDNVQDLLVPENQAVLVSRGSDTYCAVGFNALSIVYNDRPDLVPLNLTPSVVTPNTTNTMTAIVENQGDKDSTAFNVSLLVDGNIVDTQTVTNLARGSSTTVDLYWTPESTANSYTLTVNVDPENSVVEYEEDNNILKTLVGTTTAISPVAEFSANITSGDAPLTIEFTDQSSNSPTSWLWDFGDGSNSTQQNPIHTYNTTGTYTVKLTVANAGGSESKIKEGCIVVNSLVAEFTAVPISGDAPLKVIFTDQSTGTPTSWVWDFGDGTASTERSPTHIYSTNGTYTVSLEVTNVGGTNSTVKTGYITVLTTTPLANFTALPTTGSVPLTVQFTDQSTHVPTEWLWDFGDGTTSIEQNPTHTYTNLGTYAVKLTAANIAGSSTTIKAEYITVTAATGPVWTAKSEWNLPDIGSRAAPCLVDLDRDGDYDLLIGASTGISYAYENTGTASSPVWTVKSEWNVPDVGNYATVTSADLDGDGDYDLLMGEYYGATYGYENTGTTSSPIWTRNSAWDLAGPGDETINDNQASPHLADLDNDGDLDLLVGRYDGIAYGYENSGTKYSPVWTENSTLNTPDVGSCAVPCLVDLDGDEDYDLLIGASDGISYAFENKGTTSNPVWTAKSEWNLPDVGNFAKPSIADLDNDNDYDLLLGASDGFSYAYENTAYAAAAKPDLTLTILTPPSEITANIPCTISASINNTGSESADAFNAAFSVNGTVLDTQAVSGIESVSSSTVNFTWTPESAGDYSLTVTADPENGISESDETNNELSVIVTVSAISAAPVANFTSDVTSGTAPLTVNFTDQSTGSPTSWLWDFGDGESATEQNASHTYTSAGVYTVNLTVANENGTNSASALIAVSDQPASVLPVANFSSDVTSGYAPLSVQFTDLSENATEWNWNFGDGTNSTEQNPMHTYSFEGIYSVELTVTNSAGSNTSEQVGYISVSKSITDDLTITGLVNTVPGSAVFAKEANNVTVTDIKNDGTSTLTNISVSLYASDVSDGTVPVNTTTIESLESGGTATVYLIDPTLRDLEGINITYTAIVDPDNLISETSEVNNNKTSAVKPVKYNGYKGKRYWEGGSDITTRQTYDFYGNFIYSTQPISAYKGVGWTGRTETWTESDLNTPSGSTVEKVLLYVSYNWDTTTGGIPNWTATFNDNTLTNGTLYTDKSNFGTYANHTYGLYVFDVTDQFKSDGNSLVMTPGTGNSNALYPSTLVVIYKNPAETRKQIFINDECDELAYNPTGYGTTLEEATAYAPFTGMSIDISSVQNATLYSFAGSAGPNEGNLLFNGNSVATSAWQGDSSSSSAQVFDVKNYITKTGNEAGIQETVSGGMVALQQILVLEYPDVQESSPVANFTSNVTSGFVPLDVQFTDASTGNVTSWAWDFEDDGSVDSTEQNPIHTYAVAGNYTVNLTVTSARGTDSEVKIEYITVSELTPEPPVAGFTAEPTSGEVPLTVNFTDESTGSPTSWLWDFGDGENATEQNVSHMYTSAGIYTVNLTVENENGTNSTSASITVSDQPASVLPVANFSMDVSEGYAPLSVQFTDLSENATEWNWDFGDGTKATEQNPLHTYSTAGTYTVNLTVANANGTDSKLATITVSEKPVAVLPVANFSMDVSDGYAPLSVQFTDLSENATEWTWDFGDGENATDQNPSHTYSTAGIYSVNLTVANANGTDSKLATITVSEKPVAILPVANFSMDVSDGYAPLSVQFTDLSENATEWKWDFGDGESATDQNSSHTYSTAGIYSVNLTVANANGTDSKLATITVSDQPTSILPVANFSMDVSDGYAPLFVQFTDLSENATEWKWDFGDGTNATEQNVSHTYVTSGIYTVNLTVSNANGTNSKLATITVSEKPASVLPVANFSSNITEGYVPLSVQFTDLSENATEWNWDFGDGANATEQNVSHTYVTSGIYTVNLTVNNANGTNSTSALITVTEKPVPVLPVANFSSNVTGGYVPLSVQFTDLSENAAEWNWNFGDGTTSTEQNPVHIYSKKGKYTVKLTVKNSVGSNTTAKSKYINAVVLKAPAATFSASPTSGKAPLTVTFRDKSTNSPTSWDWSFGDGNTSTEQNPVHTYSEAGKYTVKLTVINAAGSSTTSKSSYINVANPVKAPTAAFSASPTSGYAPLQVTFTDKSTNSPTSWKWSFGDGTTSTEQNPVHIYSKAGTYTVNLTVKNSAGSSTTSKSSYISVANPLKAPTAAFSASPTSGKAPLTVNFIDKSKDSPTSWKWNFGDGASSTEQNPVHTYSEAGKYTVKLTAKNAAGSSTTSKSSYINVANPLSPPTAAFSASPISGSAPLTVTFTDKSTNSPASWNWNFGDGTTSTEQNPVHTYSSAGKYTVKLTVKNSAGSSTKTMSKYIVVSKGK